MIWKIMQTGGLAALCTIAWPIQAQVPERGSTEYQTALTEHLRAIGDELWGECVAKKAATFAKTRETAGDAADAVMGACSEWEKTVRQTTTKLVVHMDDGAEVAERAVAGRRAYWRGQAIAAIVEARTR